MAKHYALWPSRYSDCTDPEKLNLMPFVDEEVTNLGEFAILHAPLTKYEEKGAVLICMRQIRKY